MSPEPDHEHNFVRHLKFEGQNICSLEKFNKNSEILFFEKTLFARRFDIRRYHFQMRKMINLKRQ